jgi:hypothetical protein
MKGRWPVASCDLRYSKVCARKTPECLLSLNRKVQAQIFLFWVDVRKCSTLKSLQIFSAAFCLYLLNKNVC